MSAPSAAGPTRGRLHPDPASPTGSLQRRARSGRGLVLVVACALLAASCASSGPTPDAEVTLAEWTVAVSPAELAAGTVTLRVTNGGGAHHTLDICPSQRVDRCDGPELTQRVLVRPAQARDPSAIPDATMALVLGVGWQATVQVDLPPGTYRFFCAIVGHAPRGMQTLVTVR